jgi:cytochrome c-type biogenesis protein CcmH/NrfG
MKASSSRNSSTGLPGLSMRIPAWLVAVLILALGVAVGYLFRGSSSGAASATSINANAPSATSQSQTRGDAAIQPLLDRLRQDSNNPQLLVNIGNQYYDNHDWSKAVEYYRRSLQIEPEDVDVRTDMGTAIWYGGDPQGAIREYEAALEFQPDYPQTLFNMGIVEWQGEHDDRAALKSWQTLLQQHPEYPDRQKAEQLMQKVQAEMQQSGTTLGNR